MKEFPMTTKNFKKMLSEYKNQSKTTKQEQSFKSQLVKMFSRYAIQPLDDEDCLLMIMNDKGKVVSAMYCQDKQTAGSMSTAFRILLTETDESGNPKVPKSPEIFFAMFYETYRKIKDGKQSDEESEIDDISTLPSSGIVH